MKKLHFSLVTFHIVSLYPMHAKFSRDLKELGLPCAPCTKLLCFMGCYRLRLFMFRQTKHSRGYEKIITKIQMINIARSFPGLGLITIYTPALISFTGCSDVQFCLNLPGTALPPSKGSLVSVLVPTNRQSCWVRYCRALLSFM